MSDYVINYDIGMGIIYHVVDAIDEDEASKIAYDMAKEDFEAEVNYGCLGLATPELLEEVGLDSDV
jgi:hypothetical protein